MKKITPYLLLMVLLYVNITVSAQMDSGYTDLGSVKINTAFTQTIIIKGKDLERMPSTAWSKSWMLNGEIYLSGRNLLQSDKVSPVHGALRYYGLGVKIGW